MNANESHFQQLIQYHRNLLELATSFPSVDTSSTNVHYQNGSVSDSTNSNLKIAENQIKKQKHVEFRQQLTLLLDIDVQIDKVCKTTKTVQNLSKKNIALKISKLYSVIKL